MCFFSSVFHPHIRRTKLTRMFFVVPTNKHRTSSGVAEPTKHVWEVLNGVGVDGVGGIFPFFSSIFVFLRFFLFFLFLFAFFRFSSLFFVFLRFSSFFFAFLRFSLLFAYSPGTRANDCNLLGKWGISLRPRLHRPRSELPDMCSNQCVCVCVCARAFSRDRKLVAQCRATLLEGNAREFDRNKVATPCSTTRVILNSVTLRWG